MEQYKPYPEGHPALDLDATGYDPDRQMANAFAALLKQDDDERKRLGLKDGEFPEVNGGKVIRKAE